MVAQINCYTLACGTSCECTVRNTFATGYSGCKVYTTLWRFLLYNMKVLMPKKWNKSWLYFSLLWAFETSTLVDLGYHITLYLLASEEEGCNAVFVSFYFHFLVGNIFIRLFIFLENSELLICIQASRNENPESGVLIRPPQVISLFSCSSEM